MSTAPSPRIDYGLDAPRVIISLLCVGIFSAITGSLLRSSVSRLLTTGLLFTAGLCLTQAFLMLLYARSGKFSHRDRILARIVWQGDEQVLDVGTGLGLLMIGAAKHLTSGLATGIDIWNARDLSGNTAEATARNARLEGVYDKVRILSLDICKTGFEDASFDVVLSNLCLHNLPDAAARSQAIREIARLLKPRGRAVISDFQYLVQYRREFEDLGFRTKVSGPYVGDTFPFLSILEASRD